MKIIQHGKPKVTTKIFRCYGCGCVFEAEKCEYSSGIQYNETYYYCKCPECSETADEDAKIITRRTNYGVL